MAGEILQPTPAVTTDEIFGHFEQLVDTSTDPYVRWLASYVIEKKATDPDGIGGQITKTLEHSLAMHPSFRASDHTRGYERSLAALEIWLRNRSFVHGIHGPADWEGPHLDAFNSGAGQQYVFETFIGMNVLSNVAERAKFVKLESALDNLPQPLRLIELGSSQMHIGRKLALHLQKKSLFFKPVEVVTPTAQTRGMDTKYRTVNPDSHLLSTVISRLSYQQGPYVGVDVMDPNDRLVVAKAEGDSAYLIERARGNGRTTEFNILRRHHNMPGQSFFLADCAQPIDRQAFMAKHPEMRGGADVVLLSFVWYELPPEGRANLIKNAFKLANRHTGRVMIIDTISINERGNMSLLEQRDYNTNVYVFDNGKRQLGWQHRATLETGRGQKLVLEEAIGNLAWSYDLGIRPTRFLDHEQSKLL